MRTASTGFKRTARIRSRDAGPESQEGSEAEGRHVIENDSREPDDERQGERPGAAAHRRRGDERRDSQEDCGNHERAENEKEKSAEPLLSRLREDHEPRGSEPDGLRAREGQEKAQESPHQNRFPGNGLGEEDLRRAALGCQRENADHERRQGNEEKNELHQRYRGAGEVLNPVASGEDVAGGRDRQAEAGEDRSEDLGPARANREEKLLLGAKQERRSGPFHFSRLTVRGA